MLVPARSAFPAASILLLAALVHAETSKPNTGDQPQGFTFNYPSSPNANSVTIPITPSCPSPLVISGLSTTNNPRSADPAAPYTMTMLVHEQLMDGAGLRYERIYSRSMDIGNMAAARTVQHPWMNGTQFIGCIWSSNGVSGGCQDLTTITSSDATAAAYANATSECRSTAVMGSWVTPPSSTLDVTVEHQAGVLASNGWPASCSDIRITPKNGTAPYTLLIAPAFHPPVNITSSTRSSMNYTVRLTHGQAFMLGVYDSAGNSFAFGPLHAGYASDVSCLAVLTGQDMPGAKSGGVSVGSLAGGIVAAFLVGAAGAALALWGCVIRKHKRSGPHEKHDLLFDETMTARPFSMRINSDQSYSNPKPLDPYLETSIRGGLPFDSPDTLYDPHLGTAGSSSSGNGLPRPPGGSFAVLGRTDFGPDVKRARSREEQNQSTGSRGESSQYSRRSGGPRSSLPSSSGGLTDQRFSAGQGEGQPPPALRLVGSPAGSPSTQAWEEGSDGEEYGDPYRSTQSRGGGPGGKGRPRSAQRPLSSGMGSADSHDGQRARNVYVVHSDGGGGDVHIQLPDGAARVVELPPSYRTEPSLPAPVSPPQSGSSAGGTRPPGIGKGQPRSASGLSEGRKSSVNFGPRAPRPSSAHSSHTSHQPVHRTSGLPMIDPSRPQTPQGRPALRHTKSDIERAEAPYLSLNDEEDHYDLANPHDLLSNPHSPHPLSPSPPHSARMGEKGGMRPSESEVSFSGSGLGADEVRARAEAALAEKMRGEAGWR